jgi:hypothetical protein
MIPDAKTLDSCSRLAIQRRHTYVASNEHYRKLFLNAATQNQDEAIPNTCDAGWLAVPDDLTKCDTVFIANSTVSIIELLRKILPPSTISDANWETLTRATSLFDQDDHTTRAGTVEPEDLLDDSDLLELDEVCEHFHLRCSEPACNLTL